MANANGSRRRRRPVARVLTASWRLAADHGYRATVWWALFGRGRSFQLYDVTAESRYPVIFGFVQDAPGQAAPLYGPDDGLLPDAVYDDVVFRKTGGA